MRYEEIKISDSIRYHIDKNISLHENIFRLGSESYFNLFKEARELYNKGLYNPVNQFDEEILKDTDLGEWVNLPNIGSVPLDMIIEEEVLLEAMYKGKKVDLNKPKRGGSKKFYVYTKNPKTGKIVKVEFGAKSGGQTLAIKINDPKAKKAFAARHRCEERTDKTKPSYWSCRLPRYAKMLGLSGGGKWW